MRSAIVSRNGGKVPSLRVGESLQVVAVARRGSFLRMMMRGDRCVMAMAIGRRDLHKMAFVTGLSSTLFVVSRMRSRGLGVTFSNTRRGELNRMTLLA